MGFLIFLLPIVVVALSSWFLFKALEGDEILWKYFALSLIAIISLYGWILYAPSLGFISGFFELLFGAGASILSGIALLGFLRGYKKLIAIIVIVISPIIMFISLNIGMNFSPGAIIQRNGLEIASALEDYQTENGNYPDGIEDLVPGYIDEIKYPNTVWGWLYTIEGDEFVLGYVFWVDKIGYGLYIYRPSTSEWESIDSTLLDQSEDPFKLGPTPTNW